jgi:hypothetical protein
MSIFTCSRSAGLCCNNCRNRNITTPKPVYVRVRFCYKSKTYIHTSYHKKIMYIHVYQGSSIKINLSTTMYIHITYILRAHKHTHKQIPSSWMTRGVHRMRRCCVIIEGKGQSIYIQRNVMTTATCLEQQVITQCLIVHYYGQEGGVLDARHRLF